MATKGEGTRGWLDITAKLLPGMGAVVAGIFIPLVLHQSAERNRSQQLYTQIVSNREQADSELRARMFGLLMQYFFAPGSGSPAIAAGDSAREAADDIDRLTLLRLLALNFHEFFDLKPLYEDLGGTLDSDDQERLVAIASEIAAKQEVLLAQSGGTSLLERHLELGPRNEVMIPPSDSAPYAPPSQDGGQQEAKSGAGQAARQGAESKPPPGEGYRLFVEAHGCDTNDDLRAADSIQLTVRAHWEDRQGDLGKSLASVKFNLNYFAMPFIDNTRLDQRTRFAVTLKELRQIEDQKLGTRCIARASVTFFPESFMSSRDRPYLDEMLYQLRVSGR